MNRQMIREQRKDRKKINKKITDMIRRASQKDEEQIIEFASNITPMWEILLCYQYQVDKQIQGIVTKVLQNTLHKVNDDIGFADTLTHNTTLGFDERCVAFLAIVRSKTHDMNEISTGTLYYMLQLFEDLLEEEKLSYLEENYNEFKQMILNIQLHNILPLAHADREKLVKSCKTDLAFTLFVITAWLFLHECSLLQNVRNEWISSIRTLDELFEFLEIDNPCLKAILEEDIEDYIIDSEDVEDRLENMVTLCNMINNEEDNEESQSSETIKKALCNQDSEEEAVEEEQEEKLKENINKVKSTEEKLLSFARYCFEIKNEIERIMSYYCSAILITQQLKEVKVKNEQIEKLTKQINKNKKAQEKQKEQSIKQNEQIIALEKQLKQSQNAAPLLKENENLKFEILGLKNQVSKLKSRIDSLEKEEKISKEIQKEEKVSKEVQKELIKEVIQNEPIKLEEEIQFNDMIKEINKHKITILGGPARFSRRVKEFLPNARVIDMGSKFGEIRVGSSDYVVVYWKMLGHARTMQVEAQIKGSSTKIIYADSTNKFELCKTIYENL